jgi:Xaa-Pro aminopeptidase
MVVTVEPGIYLEGRGGVRLEEMLAITENKARIINKNKHFYDWLD